jgi:hypothetical protein
MPVFGEGKIKICNMSKNPRFCPGLCSIYADQQMRYEERFIGRRLKGVNFVYVEARLLDGSRDSKVHESLSPIPMPVVPLFFAIALKVFDREGGSTEG